MIHPNDQQHGINTTPYRGRQTMTQLIEEAVREKARILTRVYKRDRLLLVAVTILSSLLLVSVLGNIWQGMTGVRIEPYVVRVDHLGNEMPLLRLTEMPVTPEQSVIIGVLMNWTEWTRTISEDPIMLGKNWERADAYTSSAAVRQLADFRREQKLRLEQGRRVQISIPSVLPIGNKSRSYVVEWEEKAYDQDGRLVPHESGYWKATLSIADFQSQAARNERELRRQKRDYRNIMGIVVEDIKWSGRPLFLQAPPVAEGQ